MPAVNKSLCGITQSRAAIFCRLMLANDNVIQMQKPHISMAQFDNFTISIYFLVHDEMLLHNFNHNLDKVTVFLFETYFLPLRF